MNNTRTSRRAAAIAVAGFLALSLGGCFGACEDSGDGGYVCVDDVMVAQLAPNNVTATGKAKTGSTSKKKKSGTTKKKTSSDLLDDDC